MNWRSSLFWFLYSITVVALLQFPSLMLFEYTLLCSGHVMIAFRFRVSEMAQIFPFAQLLLEF